MMRKTLSILVLAAALLGATAEAQTMNGGGGGGGSGSGTVNPGTTPDGAYYATSAAALSDGNGAFAVSFGSLNLTSNTAPANGPYLCGTNTLCFATNTGVRANFSSTGNFRGNNASGWQMNTGASSATNPIYSSQLDSTTGIAPISAAIDEIVSGTSRGSWTTTGLNAATIGATTAAPGTFTTLAATTYNGLTISSLSGNTAELGTVSGTLTSGNGIVSDANHNLIDVGYVPAAVGTGAVLTSSPTTVTNDFNLNCKQFTINAASINIPIPSAASLGLGGCFDIVNATTNTYTITPNLTDNLNGANSAVTEQGNTLVRVTSNGTADFANVPSAGGSGLTIGTTTITSGTTGRSLYDNGGVVGERTVTGSGNDVLATAPTITGIATFNGTLGASPLFLFQPTGTTPDAFDANTGVAINISGGDAALEIGQGDGGSAKAYILGDGQSQFQGVTIGSVGLGIVGTGQITVSAMTSSSAAQSGTACYNTGTGAVTYDPTVGCLTSLEEYKDIHSSIGGLSALFEIDRLNPFWFTWKSGTVQARSDKAEQPGLGAHATEKVDSRLVGYGADGKLRGVRYQELVALLIGGMKQISALVLGLIIWNIALSFGLGILYFRAK